MPANIQVQVTAYSVVPSRSSAVRSYEERSTLEYFSARIAAVALSGYIFFGSSTTINATVSNVAANLQEQNKQLPTLDMSDLEFEKSKRNEKLKAAFDAAPFFILLDFRCESLLVSNLVSSTFVQTQFTHNTLEYVCWVFTCTKNGTMLWNSKCNIEFYPCISFFGPLLHIFAFIHC